MNAMDHDQEQSDSQLVAWLDEALSAEAVPGGMAPDLTQQVLDQTSDLLGALHKTQPADDRRDATKALHERTGMIARIGPTRLRALAAMVVIAASIGVVLMAIWIVGDGYQIAQVDNALYALAQYDLPADHMSEELALLDMQIRLALNDSSEFFQNDLLSGEMDALEVEIGTIETGALF